jgi:hypothetical protein
MNKSLALILSATLVLSCCSSPVAVRRKPRWTLRISRSRFSGADAAVKGQADEAVKALKAGKMFEGATALANLAKSAEKLDQGQKDAMVNLGATIQLIISRGANRTCEFTRRSTT